MKKKMTTIQVKRLIATNELTDEDYVEIAIPIDTLFIITLLYPAASPEESMAQLMSVGVELNKKSLLN